MGSRSSKKESLLRAFFHICFLGLSTEAWAQQGAVLDEGDATGSKTTSLAPPGNGAASEDNSPERVEPQIELPRLLTQQAVAYPKTAHGDAIVALRLLVQKDGTVKEATVLDGDPPFSTVAQTEALKWKFSPAKVDGVPKDAHIQFSVEFIAPHLAPLPEPSQQALPPPAPSPPEEEADEIQVVGRRIPGTSRIMSDAETRIIPGAEGDPVRAIDAMPGTVPILASGPFIGIRGSSPSMVSYQFDGITVPYLFHLARGTAVVSPWLVDSAAIYGTGGPARLGKSTAGTVEARAAKPQGRYRAHARLRLTDSALGAEAPFAQGRGNVMVAGRYSYTRPLVSLIAPDFTLNYWDYQLRTRYKVSEHAYLEFLGFGAGDHSASRLEDDSLDDLMNGSFHRASLRYTHLADDGTRDRVSFTYGHDRWDARPEPIRPRSHTFTLRYEGETATVANPSLRTGLWQYGAEAEFRLQKDEFYTDRPALLAETYHREDFSLGVWVDKSYYASSQTELNLGLRGDLFSSGESPLTEAAAGWSLSPRVSVSHQVTRALRLHTSAGLNSQLRAPAQLPPGRLLTPNDGLQYGALSDLGAEVRLPAGFSIEGGLFHNVYFDLMDAEALIYMQQQARDGRAHGQSYGFELAVKRMLSKHLRGFVAYTQTYATRSVGRVKSAAPYERRHVIDGALAYNFDDGWGLSTRATYYTGYQARMPSVASLDEAPRTTPYFQLDFQGEKRFKIDETGRYWAITLGVLNGTLSSDSNDYDCTSGECIEELVGPATIPTIGLEGEL